MPEEILETTQPNQPITESKPTNWPKIILAAVFGFALLAAAAFAGYWYGVENAKVSTQNAKTTSSASGGPQPTPSPAPVADPLTGWKTYISKYGYSIKYPPAWEVKISDWKEKGLQYKLQPDDEAIIRFTEPNQPQHGGFPFGISVSLKIPKDNPENLSPKEWVEATTSSEIPYDMEEISLSGLPAVKRVSVFNGTNITAYVVRDGKMYSVLMNIVTMDPTTGYQHLYDYGRVADQILSTFKFLD